MRYFCTPCNKKALSNSYSYVVLGALSILLSLICWLLASNVLASIIALALGSLYLIIGVYSVKIVKRGINLSDEEFHEEIVGNADYKGASYVLYPFNKKE